MEVAVVALEKQFNKGSLIALVSIALDNRITINGVKVLKKTGQPLWVCLPQQSYFEGSVRKFADIIQVDSSLYREIKSAILDELEREKT